jgi:hypothetical protein
VAKKRLTERLEYVRFGADSKLGRRELLMKKRASRRQAKWTLPKTAAGATDNADDSGGEDEEGSGSDGEIEKESAASHG